jgi:hypothetical protein
MIIASLSDEPTLRGPTEMVWSSYFIESTCVCGRLSWRTLDAVDNIVPVETPSETRQFRLAAGHSSLDESRFTIFCRAKSTLVARVARGSFGGASSRDKNSWWAR